MKEFNELPDDIINLVTSFLAFEDLDSFLRAIPRANNEFIRFVRDRLRVIEGLEAQRIIFRNRFRDFLRTNRRRLRTLTRAQVTAHPEYVRLQWLERQIAQEKRNLMNRVNGFSSGN